MAKSRNPLPLALTKTFIHQRFLIFQVWKGAPMIIGLDVGGTHTDIVLLEGGKVLAKAKVPTNHKDLMGTVITGIDQILQEKGTGKVRRVVLSTTLTTNAVVQKSIDPVGMLVSAGPGIDPEIFALGSSFHVVPGALDHRGTEIGKLNSGIAKEVMDGMREIGIRALGIVGKFSTRNPAHENELAELAKGRFEPIYCGHKISGALNFPRRIVSTWLNAAVYRKCLEFRNAIQASFKERGLTAPVHILKADGGTLPLEAILDSPGETILSGPSASVMGSLPSAPEEGDSLVIDIGGTTTDMAVLVNGVPVLEPLGAEIGGHKTLFRALKSQSIGLGGDSELHVEEGQLLIGPKRRGPAYCLGGPKPTPTDALAAMGLFEDCDKARAMEAMEIIGNELFMDPAKVPDLVMKFFIQKIRETADAMVSSINARPVYTLYEMLEGYEVKLRSILVLGGPAASLVSSISSGFGLPAETVRDWDVANAIGAAAARPTCAVTVFADTEKGFVRAPEENYSDEIRANFTLEDAVELAENLLKRKALRMGTDPHDLVTEITEAQEFSMVRGYRRSGKNIRVRAQVQPGLIRDWRHT